MEDGEEEDYMTKEWILRKWNQVSNPTHKKIMASKYKSEQSSEEE